MDASSIDMGPARSRAIQVAALAVGRGLSRPVAACRASMGRISSTRWPQVQIAAASVDGVSQAWVYATFVSRADFEAYFVVREAPGTSAQLRRDVGARGVHRALRAVR